ncbi:MAG: DegT/DnrJ/EryC1/StrS family aminotransferase [Chloroflexota bacterium]
MWSANCLNTQRPSFPSASLVCRLITSDYSPFITKRHGLTLIEDNAQYFLATYQGQVAGTFGRAASFSLQGSKHMTSGGSGGVVIANDKSYARLMRKAAIQGYSTIEARPGSTMIPRDERQDWSFERHDAFGYNFRFSAPQAALGLAQLERLDYLVAARRYIATQYERVIREEKCEWLIPPYVPAGYTHAYWCYTCKLDEALLGVDWRTFRKTFIAHGGGGLYGLWCPVHLEPVFRELSFYGAPERSPNFDSRYYGTVRSYQAGDCPNVEAFRRVTCLFKTGMQSLDVVHQQAEALQATIRAFG